MVSSLSPALASPAQSNSILLSVLGRYKSALTSLVVLSGLLNLLMLTGSLFMLEVYDRVIPSQSIPTLLALFAIATALYIFQSVFDLLRGRILVRLGYALDESLNEKVFRSVLNASLLREAGADGFQPVRDLDHVRAFLASSGPSALLDLPWMPLYLLLCFAFHPLIGLVAAVGGLALSSLTILSEVLSRRSVRAASEAGMARNSFVEAGSHNAEIIKALGLGQRLTALWSEAHRSYLANNRQAYDVAGALSAISKAFRLLLQSGVLAVGAYLVVQGQATGGIMIASSILVARALSPVELAIANWKNFLSARQSFSRLRALLSILPATDAKLTLPPPRSKVSVEKVSIQPPGANVSIVKDVSFSLTSGQGLGIVGPSASGKSTLARALVGIWPAVQGRISLDRAALEQWPTSDLGEHIGYLPQSVGLFDGTIASNIARLQTVPDATRVIAAANAAGVHEMILDMPDGYETRVGKGGIVLSGGQNQRIGLARALYGDPFLVVLDEPNANLDAPGDEALTRAVIGIRQRGGIVIVIAHRPSAIAGVNLLLLMKNGEIEAFGEKQAVIDRFSAPKPAAQNSQVVDARS